ncbi:glycosyltransferase involved in cell wall biosynthesis [Spirosoma oryzae]|uniref:Glycosyltransferase involved in cell wall biosynthesis n=1 Tax=Spirosoma oryzae TaxID=1469603 RepID=A0A2T0SW95_9BACT|nr:glycosyltransferase family 4 protein [Spirosoma oryzae]PRY37660.1 glycosyltransferase involved in cell wall biosynthesis [Spirosoma oryzae]
MKTVLISAYACIPGQGSEEGTGWTYASTLSQNGYRVHCLTKKDGQSVIDPILASGQYPNLTVHYVHVPDWVDTFCGKGLIGMYFHYLYWQWTASNLALALDKTDPIDLIHHVSYGSIQLGSFMYRLHKPFVFGPVGGGQRAPKSLKRYFGSFWTREWMRDWVGTLLQYVNPAFYRTVRQADQLIVTNLDTLRLARTLRPTAPVERIWDASLSRTFLPAEPIQHTPGATLKLLWVGRLLPRKALELTIQALGQVDPAIPVTLTIVGGKGEMVDHVPGYLERYGVADRVDWVGHVTFQQVKAYYEQSDVFFFTSLRDSCPHQLLEAMAYSLPVVTLMLHGQAELVDDSTGIRVPVGTEEQVVAALARAIEWMYHHPAERLAMGQAGYDFAQTQLWDTKIRLFTDRIYPAILSEPAVLAEHD